MILGGTYVQNRCRKFMLDRWNYGYFIIPNEGLTNIDICGCNNGIKLPYDEFEKIGYIAFWNEWNVSRNS